MSASDPSSFFGIPIYGKINNKAFKQFLLDHKNLIAQQICIKLEKSDFIKNILGGKHITCETVHIDDIINAINNIINTPSIKAVVLKIPIDSDIESQLSPYKTLLISTNILTEDQYNIILHLSSFKTEMEKLTDNFAHDHPGMIMMVVGAGEEKLNKLLAGILIILIIICSLYICDYLGIFSFDLPDVVITRKFENNSISKYQNNSISKYQNNLIS